MTNSRAGGKLNLLLLHLDVGVLPMYKKSTTMAKVEEEL